MAARVENVPPTMNTSSAHQTRQFPQDPSGMPLRTRHFCVVAVLGVIAIGAAAAFLFRGRGPASEDLLHDARLALARGDHRKAEELARRAAEAKPPSPWALLVAAEAALKTNRYGDALAYYRRVPRDSPAVAASADFGEAEMLCHLGRVSESEGLLKQLLSRDPQHNLAHFRLAFLLNITGRRWEAQPHLLYLVRNRAADMEQLLLLGNSQRQIEDTALLDATARLSPGDPLPKLGAARLALALNRSNEARPLLKAVLLKLPDEPEAVVRWGQLLLEEADSAAFVAWSSNLSPAAERHPEAWMLRGLFSQQCGQPQAAARCFWEALLRDPEHRAACHQLGRTLTELNDADRGAPFLERADLLQRLSTALDDLFHHRDHFESMRRAALLTRQLGRLWEAASWSSIALSIDPDLPWAMEILREVSPQLRPDLPRTSPANDPSRQLDLSNFPLPDWPKSSTTSPSPLASGGTVPEIRFADRAREVGIDFRYENGADDTSPGARIFETTGGGAGVIDYDLDGWPDLYLTQGGKDPGRPSSVSEGLTDRLFRNLNGGRFEDVTVPARLGDRDFSQGVAVGDFDNDGFPDLYVANLGRNRLYLNRGDGTFADITDEAGITGSLWTTSCLMADLNGDGFPDLYDVNYAAGESLLTRVCEKQGVIRSCSPRAFDAAPDRLWLNRGDGRVRDATAESGIDVPGGYGLGIVALDLDGSGRLGLFVANDEVPNFLFVNKTGPKEPVQLTVPAQLTESVLFEEHALLAGVALDADGMSQACMGVAAGDADRDGLTDLFVTNFYQESNTLYRQVSRGQFADVTRTARLRDPSFAMLGFGTQFLDADLDGWEDLVVTNGHIDDLTSIGEPYKMPAQFFRNLGRGRFAEVPASTLGPFFRENHLGRGLARLDWNRDGRDDFVVSQLREPAGLLTNETPSAGHFLAVQLRGTRSSRDAIGATVEITTGGDHRVMQLTAGDGYHASNERQLRFGLGPVNKVDELKIHWPGGPAQSWKGVSADQVILVIEGTPRWWALSR
jgi:tetratricopeptide (TPR) repeat protein